jgi:ABC-2 type transport system permease protein
MALTPLAAMVRKDLLLFFSDRRSVIMSFAVPILIASFFGSVFSGVGSNTERARVAVAVVDNDGSAISQNIVSGLQRDPNLRVSTPSEKDARDAVAAGRISVAVVLPKDFSEQVVRAFLGGGARPNVPFLYDPSRGIEMAMVRGVMTPHVLQAFAQSLPRGASSLVPGLAGLNSGGLMLPYDVHEEAMAGPNAAYNGYAHSFAGMAIQFLLFAMANLGVDMLLERQRGLWRRLRSAPVSRLTLLGGKALSGTIISFLILAVSFAFSMIVFKVRVHGSVAGFLGVMVACSFMASTFGLLVAALGNSPATARGVTSLAVLMMVMLGGAWVPTFIFPAWLQRFTLILPVRWAIDGLDATTWRGSALASVLPAMGVLVAFAAAFALVAAQRFKWEEA